MYFKIMRILFLFLVCLFVFNSGDLHSCEDDGDHEPVCDDCSCVFCATGLIGITNSNPDSMTMFYPMGKINPDNDLFNFGDITFEIDQPPRV